MTFLHGGLLLITLAVLAAGGISSVPRVLALTALPWFVPAITVAFRAARRASRVSMLPALVLYQVYYLARLQACVRLGLRRRYVNSNLSGR